MKLCASKLNLHYLANAFYSLIVMHPRSIGCHDKMAAIAIAKLLITRNLRRQIAWEFSNWFPIRTHSSMR